MVALAVLLCACPLAPQDDFPAPPARFERIADEGTIIERMELAVWLLRENERRVLAPTDAQRDSMRELLKLSDTGITALAANEGFKARTLVDGYGTYFSFEYESHGPGYLVV
jgi:hypothetical protein